MTTPLVLISNDEQPLSALTTKCTSLTHSLTPLSPAARRSDSFDPPRDAVTVDCELRMRSRRLAHRQEGATWDLITLGISHL